jgi:hypothetical protein
MWMLLAVNALILAGLLFTLWRLHHVHAVLTVREQRLAAARQPVTRGEPRRHAPPPARRSALDEFPSENSLEYVMPPLHAQRPRSSAARPSHRLAPVGR